MADNGQDAWRILQQSPAPPLAILDWMMPGLDGFDLARRVRKSRLNQTAPIVIVTGRDCPQGIIDIADTVTEMRKVKHAFDAGITAKKGIEY